MWALYIVFYVMVSFFIFQVFEHYTPYWYWKLRIIVLIWYCMERLIAYQKLYLWSPHPDIRDMRLTF